jgi:hypothetical protein
MKPFYDFEDFEDFEGLDPEIDLEGISFEALSSGQRRQNLIRNMNRRLPQGRNRWFISKRQAHRRANQAAKWLSRRTGRRINVHHHVYRPLGLRHYHLSDPSGRFLKLRFIYIEVLPQTRSQEEAFFEDMLYEGHGGAYQTERQIFLRNLLKDPNQPRHVRGWVQQELNRLERIRQARLAKKDLPGGDPRRLKGVPGYDVGHRIPGEHDHKKFKLEHASTNRARPGIARRLRIKRYR